MEQSNKYTPSEAWSCLGSSDHESEGDETSTPSPPHPVSFTCAPPFSRSCVRSEFRRSVSGDAGSETHRPPFTSVSRKPSLPSSLVGGEMVSGCHAKLKSPKSPCRTKEKSLFWTMSAMMGTTEQSQRGQSTQDHGWWRITSCFFSEASMQSDSQMCRMCVSSRGHRGDATPAAAAANVRNKSFPQQNQSACLWCCVSTRRDGASDHV